MRSTRIRLGALGAAVVTAILPLTLASPAEATQTKGQCTVHPERPYFEGKFHRNGKKLVTYPISVKCAAKRAVQIQQRFLERDVVKGVSKYSDHGSASYSRKTGSGLRETIKAERVLPYKDTDGYDEVLHKVRFRVTSNGVTSSWTPWDFSAVRQIKQ